MLSRMFYQAGTDSDLHASSGTSSSMAVLCFTLMPFVAVQREGQLFPCPLVLL